MKTKRSAQCRVLLQSWVLVLAVGILSACGGGVGGGSPLPGTILSVQKGGGQPLPDAAENYFVTYVSRSLDGTPVPVSGQIAIPSTPMPSGGYPVVSWAQGTTGLGPQCAPSDSPSEPTLDEWVKRGYAVVRTDYKGWGKLGPRPLLNQRSNAADVVNMVIAAHQVSDKLSPNWIVVGHSEGGGATLWTAALGANAAATYSLKGGIALAPVGPGVLGMVSSLEGGVPISRDFPLLTPYLAADLTAVTVQGSRATDPTIQLDDLVTPQFRPWVDATASVCFDMPASLTVPDVGQYLKPGASYDKLVAFLRAQDASSQTIPVPVMIAQAGSDDLTPTPQTTLQMVHSLCANGSKSIDLRTYAGQSHQDVIAASLQDAFTYAGELFAGQQMPAGACASN